MRIAIVGVVPLAERAEVLVSAGMGRHCGNPKLTGIVCAGAEGACGMALVEAGLSLKRLDRIVLLHAKPHDLSRDAVDALQRGASAISVVDAAVPLWKHALDYPDVRGLLVFSDRCRDVDDAVKEAMRRKLPIRRVPVYEEGARR